MSETNKTRESSSENSYSESSSGTDSDREAIKLKKEIEHMQLLKKPKEEKRKHKKEHKKEHKKYREVYEKPHGVHKKHKSKRNVKYIREVPVPVYVNKNEGPNFKKKEPTQWNIFVKENYGKYDKDSQNYKEIMGKLADQYNIAFPNRKKRSKRKTKDQ